MSNQELLYAAFSLLALLALIVQSFWLYKSVPPQYVDKLLNDAESIAKQTPDTRDDQAVAFARWLRGVFASTETLKQLSEQELAAEERANKDAAIEKKA